MATSYRYRLFDTEFGPVSFLELVALVRDGTVGADDLVQAEWESDWHPAAEVVGLFHMAGREDVLARWQVQQREQCADATTAVTNAEDARSDATPEPGPADDVHEGSVEPSWMQRLREVDEKRRQVEEQKRREEEEERAAARTQKAIEQTIHAAVEGAEARDRARQPGRVQRVFSSVSSRESLSRLYRWGMTFAAANLVAWGILSWTEREAMRFPDRRAAADVRVFPLWGKCSSAEYLFLLGDAMLGAGVGGYGLARLLESYTDG